MTQNNKRISQKISFPWLILFGALSFICTSLSFSEEPVEEREKSLKYYSSTAFSLVLTKGNSESFSYSFDTEQNLHLKQNRFNLKAQLIKARADGEKTSELYYSHLKYDREVNKKLYLLGLVRYEQNKLSGNNYRLALSGGGGIVWIEQEQLRFYTELALGWSNENKTSRVDMKKVNGSLTDLGKAVSSAFLSSIIANKLTYNISKSAQLMFQETIFINIEDTKDFRLNTYSAISTAINSRLALKTSIQVLFENQPVLGYKQTDVFLLSSLVLKI